MPKGYGGTNCVCPHQELYPEILGIGLEIKTGPSGQKVGDDKWDGRSRIRLKSAKT